MTQCQLRRPTPLGAETGDRVRVRRSMHTLTLLRPRGHSYYDMLRQKLHWGEKL